MSEIKTISRPKVRFSQFSDNDQNKEKTFKTCNNKAVVQTSGPKIRNIVSLTKPVRIVKSKRSTDIHDVDMPLKSYITEVSTYPNGTISENIQRTSFSKDNVPEIETSKILKNANSTQNSNEGSNMLQLDKSTYMQNNTLKHSKKILQEKGKENVNIIPNTIASNNNITHTKMRNIQCVKPVVHEKLKHSMKNNNTQNKDTVSFNKSKMIKSQSTSIMKKTETSFKAEIHDAKPIKSNVMSCYKYIKDKTKKYKVSPVKKTVIHSTTGPKIKTSVEPGILYKHQDDLKVDDVNKKYNIASVTIANKLAQPEYNSIMCTTNKMKELKQLKIITDINNLPPKEKNILNEKISTALDFPLDEAVFKNLVDLSIDDKQLPPTVIRSKDPEPRQKDISPKLEDFFVPEHTKEICIAVHVKPRVSKIDENKNVFKISDKILDWKYSLDFSQIME